MAKSINATTFEFTSYQFEPAKKRILFHYKTQFNNQAPLAFTETIILPQVPKLNGIPKETINKLLESLHIMLGISYYKFYCPPNIKLPYKLSKDQAEFFNTVYQKGLGEFFYVNKLDPKISPKFPFNKNIAYNERSSAIHQLQRSSNYLVGIGGGKDSIVAAELLKQQGFDITAFYVATGKDSPIVNSIINLLGIKNLKIQRILDQKVHDQHAYNGHIPISAVYAFLGTLTSLLYGYQYFVVGNEHSSNFGNTDYKGLTINHQWSKSFEFEKLFQNYVKNFITQNVTYFSLMRSLYEIRIVKLFSNYRKYFPLFSSCNRNFSSTKTTNGGLWCGQCAKCVFAFTLLSAYLSKKELLEIFRKNLYQDKNLLPLFKDILGFGTMKPFDCVGTFEEARTAMFMAKKKFANDFIMRQLGDKVRFYPEVFLTNKENLITTQCKLLGMESALIVGYGKEGKITKEYLKRYYPKLKIGVADEKQGSDYLKKQAGFDVAVKSPGIKKEMINIPYTTATNLFFSQMQGKHIIIGVTGSKGKSTTSTLIYEILKASGKNVQLLGNIGKPMLKVLLKPIKKNTIFVLELSSYQLDDMLYSPDIAVVTNLFPEHLDFHGNLQNYYQAKKNIIHFQKNLHTFIYNPNHKILTAWAKEHHARAVPFVSTMPLKETEIPLIGEHNQSNIKAAIAATKLLGVSDAAIKKAIKSFKGLPHRLQNVGTFKGITFYDDAISTTPESTIEAINTLKNVDTIFLGGTDRGYNFTNLEKTLKKYKITNIVLFPDSGKRILKNTKGLTILKTRSMSQAVVFAFKHTKQGKICLLSCASPSYSLWKDFEEKGNSFQEEIKKMSGN